MRPPICAICGKRFNPRGGLETYLVYFKRTERDEKWHERVEKEPGFVGHPPEAEWFCPEHIQLARKFQKKGLTLPEAYRMMMQELNSGDSHE